VRGRFSKSTQTEAKERNQHVPRCRHRNKNRVGRQARCNFGCGAACWGERGGGSVAVAHSAAAAAAAAAAAGCLLLHCTDDDDVTNHLKKKQN
jgi:hypothetical protein